MKDIIIALSYVIGSVLIIWAVIFWISGMDYSYTEQQRMECRESGGIYNLDTGCKTKYDQCLHKLRNTFSDLSDTWGTNTNNQDSISKTIQSEIDRCLIN